MGPSFTFTVAGRTGQFAPPAGAGRPNTVRISTDYLRGVEKFWRYLPLTRSSQVCHQKIFLSLLHSIGIQLIPAEFWLRPHQVVSSCWSSAPPLSSVNDGSLLTNTSEDAQQTCTYKISTSVHTCACVFLLQLRSQ